MTLPRLVFAALLITLASCAVNDVDNTGTITGVVSEKRNLKLPEKVTLVIRLEEVSFGLTNSRIVAENHIKEPGSFPMSYEIDYPLDAIRGERKYSITATIYFGNQLLLRSDLVHYVLTNGNPDTADLVVRTAVMEP